MADDENGERDDVKLGLTLVGIVLLFLFTMVALKLCCNVMVDAVILRDGDSLRRTFSQWRRVMCPWCHPRTEPQSGEDSTSGLDLAERSADAFRVDMENLLIGLTPDQKKQLLATILSSKTVTEADIMTWKNKTCIATPRSTPEDNAEVDEERVLPKTDLDVTINNNSMLCAICIHDIGVGESIYHSGPCDHVFHNDCLSAWLSMHSRSCPYCRQEILTQQMLEEAYRIKQEWIENASDDEVSLSSDGSSSVDSEDSSLVRRRQRKARGTQNNALAMCSILLLVFSCAVTITAVEASWDAEPPKSHWSSSMPSPTSVLVLDVDNTLYDEQHAKIEQQIVQRTHSYCETVLNLLTDQADDLFRAYGSTIEGLRHTIWKDLSPEMLQDHMDGFYHHVYGPIDPSSLLLGNSETETTGSTGYSHDANAVAVARKHRLTRLLLQHCPDSIVLASNSPSWHVQKVLCALGMSQLSDKSTSLLFTPDQRPLYPTKHQPRNFFATNEGISLMHTAEVALVEDSLHNIQQIQSSFPGSVRKAYHISRSNDGVDQHGATQPVTSVSQALMFHYGFLDPKFIFSDVRYLQAKNKVDVQAMNVAIWNRVMDELRHQVAIASSTGDTLWIVDVGAGLLSMLDLMLHGNKPRGFSALEVTTTLLCYTAYESNQELYPTCHERLESWGFELMKQVSPTEMWYRHRSKPFEVQLLLRDFMETAFDPKAPRYAPNVIIGCCFADLMDPQQLASSLVRSFGLLHKTPCAGNAALLYFPVTFTGITQFLPARPFELNGLNTKGAIPSDTVAFRIYSDRLESDFGHNLDVQRLIECMQDHGATLVTKELSRWYIDPIVDPYLYETMMYFFGSTAGPQLLKQGYDAGGWIRRARSLCPAIHVTNKDLLFRMGPEKVLDDSSSEHGGYKSESREIVFTEAYQVSSAPKELPLVLGPRQILIQSSYSLISSGTELKIFRGDFDADAALDISIEDMEGRRMAYPLSYGYCLVGEVVDAGSNVDPSLKGKLVFTFSPHATHVVTDVDAIQIVPDGIDPQDAIFMPSIETALSLVHDAHVWLGENVAVYGQGLIGLLVTALLAANSNVPEGSSTFSKVSTFDSIPDRLAASAAMGASEALFPGGSKGPFDVSIEVSGNGKALQAAIDNTRDGGRIIVGSWYGNSSVQLKLGIEFHRSHKSITTSQVSEIPAHLSSLWSKQRRFDLTWELVRDLKPSQLLTKIVELDRAQDAYEALNKGSEIAVAFKYLS